MKKCISLLLVLILTLSFVMITANASTDSKLMPVLERALEVLPEEGDVPLFVYAEDPSAVYDEICAVTAPTLKRIDEDREQIFLSVPRSEIGVIEAIEGVLCIGYDYDGAADFSDLDVDIESGVYLQRLFEKTGVTIEDFSNSLEFHSRYREPYIHRNDDKEADWALVSVSGGISDTAILSGVIGGRGVYLGGSEYPFKMRYALYDAGEDTFYDLYLNNDVFDRYDGLYEAWQTLDLSDLSLTPKRGDANADTKLDITDATVIQRFLAGYFSKSFIDGKGADFDEDGGVTIIDATKIQKALANII